MQSFKEPFVLFIRSLQDKICKELESIDGIAVFKEELWTREGGGGGRTRVIEKGNIFEKGGVNISEVYGTLPESMVQYLKVSHNQFFACGISLVIHPQNPFVPTVHANYRYFELYDENNNVVDLWCAGGADLTPYYLFEEDAIHFHSVQKKVCDSFDPTYYPTFKKACDNYFFNHHRGEARGIGGLFFDYLRETSQKSAQHWFDFTTSVGNAFLDAYLPIVLKRKSFTYSNKNKHWQEIRRGRYVEFNLIHDKGTLFGLKTNGRIESILMSLPPTVRWEYNYLPDPNSPESELLKVLVEPKDWIKI
ncbi:MAG: oxygen-dependent coproporphyrinogen oxidase [Bacteroidia bacterium]